VNGRIALASVFVTETIDDNPTSGSWELWAMATQPAAGRKRGRGGAAGALVPVVAPLAAIVGASTASGPNNSDTRQPGYQVPSAASSFDVRAEPIQAVNVDSQAATDAARTSLSEAGPIGSLCPSVPLLTPPRGHTQPRVLIGGIGSAVATASCCAVR
jgi:hypothetical protein